MRAPSVTFTDGVDVVVEGRMGQDGTFRATTLLAKCASRYENAPGGAPGQPGQPGAKHPEGISKYGGTPGYQSATPPAPGSSGSREPAR